MNVRMCWCRLSLSSSHEKLELRCYRTAVNIKSHICCRLNGGAWSGRHCGGIFTKCHIFCSLYCHFSSSLHHFDVFLFQWTLIDCIQNHNHKQLHLTHEPHRLWHTHTPKHSAIQLCQGMIDSMTVIFGGKNRPIDRSIVLFSLIETDIKCDQTK